MSTTLSNRIWGSTTPPPSPPPTSSSTPLPLSPTDEHLAFRSITLMTSKIQQKSDTAHIEEESPKKNRVTLLLSVAFSILVALQYEVVAVTAKVVSKGNLQVIVCPSTHTHSPQNRSFLQVVLDTVKDLIGLKHISVLFLASRNPRSQDNDHIKSPHPRIVDCEFPPSLSEQSTEQELNSYVQALW
jgi:hypothetical protein